MSRNETNLNDFAVLVSPPYNRSRDGKSKCLKFRYMLRGTGKKSLTIYQKRNGFREIPIWVSKHSTGQNWIYGQVPLTSLSDFQVIIIDVGVKSVSPATPIAAHSPSQCILYFPWHSMLPGTFCLCILVHFILFEKYKEILQALKTGS